MSLVELGVEVLLSTQRQLIAGKRLGLVTNYTMTDRCFRPIIDALHGSTDWRLVKLFGPEHGVQNSAKEGEHVSFCIDAHTGLPAYSLYGETRQPSAQMLEDLDVLVIDLQDIGTRYYTNMNTVYYCLEACAKFGLPCIVLDRPNPINGVTREGNILDTKFQSFVGMHKIPNRHGLTMGELAIYFQNQLSPNCNLTVIPANGWRRDMYLPETGLPFVATSPNTATFEMCLLYPGTCLFEGTNVSVGRGTAHPFETIGSPYIDGHQLARWFNQRQCLGVVARPVYFVPTYASWTGELCQGVQLHITDRHLLQSVRAGIVLLQGISQLYSEQFQFLGGHGQSYPFIDLLAGTDKLRDLILSGQGTDYLDRAQWEVEAFSDEIKGLELYQC